MTKIKATAVKSAAIELDAAKPAVAAKPKAKASVAKASTKKVAAKKKPAAKKAAAVKAPKAVQAPKEAAEAKVKKPRKAAVKKAKAISPIFLDKLEYKALIAGLMDQGIDHADAVDTLKVGMRQLNGIPVPPALLMFAGVGAPETPSLNA